MRTAKIISAILILGIMMLTAVSCSSTAYSSRSQYSDDLYVTHDRGEIAKRKAAEAEAARLRAENARLEAEANEARIRAMLAELGIDVDSINGYVNPYEDILADDYESAYERRLRGFNSPTYRMPSSYYNFRYGSAYNYATAYDPAFYNIIVMGDQVWVEPKYITSMFGTWGAPPAFGFSWGTPGWSMYANSYWGYPYYGWNGYYGYPCYSWGWPYYNCYPGYWHGGYCDYGGYWGGGGGYYYNDKVTHKPSRPTWSNGYRGGNSASHPSVGNSSYRSGSGSSSGGSYRSGGSSSGNYRSGSSGSSSYSRGNSSSGSSYSRGSSSSSSGSYGGGSSSGSSYSRGSSSSGSSSYGSYGGGSSGSSGGSSSGGGRSTSNR